VLRRRANPEPLVVPLSIPRMLALLPLDTSIAG